MSNNICIFYVIQKKKYDTCVSLHNTKMLIRWKNIIQMEPFHIHTFLFNWIGGINDQNKNILKIKKKKKTTVIVNFCYFYDNTYVSMYEV